MIRKSPPGLALELLMRNPVQNRYPILRIKQGGVKDTWIRGGSVCLHDYIHNKYCYAVESAEDLRALYEEVEPRGGELISLVTDQKYLPIVHTLSGNILTNVCVQFCSVPYKSSPPKVKDIQFGAITEDFAKWMMTVYDHPALTLPFILRRAEDAPAVAAFYRNEPAGFFITHSDAELGPIYVSPALRGSGLATALFTILA